MTLHWQIVQIAYADTKCTSESNSLNVHIQNLMDLLSLTWSQSYFVPSAVTFTCGYGYIFQEH